VAALVLDVIISRDVLSRIVVCQLNQIGSVSAVGSCVGRVLRATFTIVWLSVRIVVAAGPLDVDVIALLQIQDLRHKIIFSRWESLNIFPLFPRTFKFQMVVPDLAFPTP